MSKEEHKQETLEEAAERLQKDKYGIFISKDAEVKGQLVIDTAKAAFLSGMTEGAKWQQDNSDKKYSEQDIQNVLDGFTNEAPGEYIKTNFIGLLNKNNLKCKMNL